MVLNNGDMASEIVTVTSNLGKIIPVSSRIINHEDMVLVTVVTACNQKETVTVSSKIIKLGK